MSKQLTNEARNKLHLHLNNKIQKADLEVRKLMYVHVEHPETKEIEWGDPIKKPYPEVLEKKIKGYTDQIENCQLSLRVVWNTSWIAERRDEILKTETERSEKEYPTKIADAEKALAESTPETKEADQKRLDGLLLEVDALEEKIHKIKNACRCNKRDCWGRGYKGFNVSTGEYSFCTCTLKIKHYFNVPKS